MSNVSRNLSGLWIKCPSPDCGKTVYKKDVDAALKVCPECHYHFRVGGRERIRMLLDEGSFQEIYGHMAPDDPLGFEGYAGKVRKDAERTGLLDAAITGRGTIGGSTVFFGVTDSYFIMGSMGSVVGEKVARLADLAREERRPLIMVSGSGGGARMQEGVVSLMQMAKTSTAIARLQEGRGLFISVLTHPTMGGVMASYAALGDVILAEPKAQLGFAGPRVIQQTIRRELPKGFQTAEFCLEHGFIDRIVHRKDLRSTLQRLLGYYD